MNKEELKFLLDKYNLTPNKIRGQNFLISDEVLDQIISAEKISKSDLKADAKKNHNHDKNGNYIKYLWFAMPKKLMGCEDLVPENAGIIYIDKWGFSKIFRKANVNK